MAHSHPPPDPCLATGRELGWKAEPELVAENIACRRGERLVFAGLSLRLPAGGALLLTGANGSGKTSLLRLLATLIPPAAGRLGWGEAQIEADIPAYRKRLHYVGHHDGIKPALTPRETLVFWAVLRGNSVPAEAPAIEAALTAFALDAFAAWPCRWLSAGQRRRLALARLVATRAPVWLLDEPTSALDTDNQTRLERLIADHRTAGGRVVVASHIPIRMDDAAALGLDAFAPALGDTDAF
jgi:heme exporter protein A